MVAGDLVNTAARVQSVAAPGVVLVGEATVRAAAGAIAFEPAGERALKGKAAPVPTWRALRVIAERGGRGRADGLEAPSVGRDAEFRVLKELFHATGRERRVRLVSITGQAGIGKSRLAWELEKYLDGLVEAVWWHHGRSPAYGSGITFWALGEMVRSRAGLAEQDDEATTRARISETVTRFVPDPVERAWIEPALLALLGVGEATSSVPEQLFPAWRTFFERIAAHGTVAMVFEDLQWADPGLLAFIEHVSGWSQGWPILIVTLARPELLETHPEWGSGQRRTSIALGPLDEAAMRSLLEGLVPGLPAAAASRIVTRADGVPLYAVETVRMLLADGRIALEDGVCRPVGDLSALEVPETLRSLIASRLDALEPAERALLQSAAVLGQTFTLGSLAAVEGTAEAELGPRLGALVRREMLVQRADPRAPDRGQYAFAQSLLREVAYGTLARDDRRVRHLAAARYFEGLATDELAGALAVQYEAAYRSSRPGPEMEALAIQARRALRAAGERALSLGSPEQARELMGSALELAADAAEQAALLERAADAARLAGQPEEASGLLEQAVTIHLERGDRSAAARASALRGEAFLTASRLEAAVALLRRAAEEFADLGDDPGLTAVLAQLARTEMLRQEDLAGAIALADRGLALAEKLDLVPIVADLLITRGTALSSLGRTYEGLGAIEAGRLLAAENGLVTTEARALTNVSGPLLDHDPRATLEAARAAVALARRIGSRPAESMAVSNLAEAARLTGDWDLAVRELRRLEASPSEELRILVLVSLVVFAAARGEDVAERVEQVRSIQRSRLEDGEPEFEAFLHGLEAAVAGPAGRYGEAARAMIAAARLDPYNATTDYGEAIVWALLARDPDLVRETLAGLDGTGAHGNMVTLSRRLGRAGLAALEGRTDEARSLFREVGDAYRRAELPYPVARTGLVMAVCLDPSLPDVRAATDEARAIFERLGAGRLIERLDEALALGPAARIGPSGVARIPVPTVAPDRAGQGATAPTGR
jgi:predicted ATPase